MSTSLSRWIVAGLFAFHGIGQLMGVLPALRPGIIENANVPMLQNWSSYSWLFTPAFGKGAARAIAVILFSVPFFGFAAAALAVLNWGVPYGWWRSLALISAYISLIALFFYWNGLLLFFPHKVGDIAVNCAVIVGLIVMKWPTDAQLGY